MEWGTWKIANSFAYADSSNGTIDNHAYYLKGTPTPEDFNLGNTNYTYAGDAGGTWWTDAGGIALSGTFSYQINNTAITDFDLNVVDNTASPSYGVSIENATVGMSDNSFSITGGIWEFHRTTAAATAATYKSASGSLYGPNAESVGGVWGMREDDTTSSLAASGYFEGSKGATPQTPPTMPTQPKGGGGGADDAGGGGEGAVH